MPTYLNPEGKIVQTGQTQGLRGASWIGFLAVSSHTWDSSFSIYAHNSLGLSFHDEQDVLASMGHRNMKGLRLISQLPEVIEIVSRLIPVEGDIS